MRRGFREVKVREVEKRFDTCPLVLKALEEEAERIHEEVAERNYDESLARYKEACNFWDSLMQAQA